MPLPPRYSWSIHELACRWGCMPADIIDWSIAGHVEIVTTIKPTLAGGTEFHGIAAIPAECAAPMFRRDGSGPRTATIYRLRNPGGGQEWQRIQNADGLQVEQADVFVTNAEVEKFEVEHQLVKKVAQGGSAPRWDWDGFYVQMIRRIHNQGLPEHQSELVSEMQDWFIRRSDNGNAPDESTIRRRVRQILEELNQA